MSPDLVSIGFSVLDILVRQVNALPAADQTTFVDEIQVTAAGTAAAPAVIGARNGLRTSLIGCAGDDLIGRTLLMALAEEGIELGGMQRVTEQRTSATVLPVATNGDRPNLHAVGAALMLQPPPVEQVSGARFVHYGGVGLHPFFDGEAAAAVLASARAAGATVTCDTTAAGPEMFERAEPILPHIDYLMPRADEAQAISSTATPEEAAAFFLERGVGTCIFKDGPRGSLVFTASGVERVPAFSIDVVDTTGCGDAYCGGFISGLAHGMKLLDACRFASATSALVASGLGSQGKVVGYEDTVAAMNRMNVIS